LHFICDIAKRTHTVVLQETNRIGELIRDVLMGQDLREHQSATVTVDRISNPVGITLSLLGLQPLKHKIGHDLIDEFSIHDGPSSQWSRDST
jgi:hypothetical protein